MDAMMPMPTLNFVELSGNCVAKKENADVREVSVTLGQKKRWPEEEAV
jgi:hypothetical protein